MPTPTIDQLRKALAIAEQIQKLEEEYASIMGGKAAPAPSAPATKTTKRGRKPFSAETKAKMAAAAKLRWAKKGGAVVKPIKVAKKKRVLSPEHKAKLIAAVKARWAKVKKGM